MHFPSQIIASEVQVRFVKLYHVMLSYGQVKVIRLGYGYIIVRLS